MQRAGLNIQIPSSSLFCSQRRNKYDAVGKRGGRRVAHSSSTPSSDPFAFLKQKIEEIRISDEQYLSRYGIDIKESFEKLKRTYRKFSEYYGCEYKVDYTGCETTADRILKLAESFDEMSIVRKMKEIVPEYISQNSVYSMLDAPKEV